MKDKKVLVSGCYDLMHGGHIAFFKTAAEFGRLYVAVGTDMNLSLLKGRSPRFSQEERCYLVNAVRFVEEAFPASGSGMLDFEPDLARIKPDIFIVNSDGHTPEKEALCMSRGIEYKVLERIPDKGLPARSSTAIKQELQFPYRICLAGGWMDQPWVSEIFPGSVVVAQVLPSIEFNARSGMATSSREVALKIWGNRYPPGDPVENAKLLFGAENPPGSAYISGSQDHIGLLSPGINRLLYSGNYWPEQIDSTTDRAICSWLSSVIHLIPLKPRPAGYNPIGKKNITKESIKALAFSGQLCWQSILDKDAAGLGESLTQTLRTWKKMLPDTVPEEVLEELETKYLSHYPGAVTSGSGGGYAVVVSENAIEGAIHITVRI